MVSPLTVHSLPNEIILSVFGYLTTRNLLSLTAVSRRFYSAAVTQLHDRILRAASLPEHRLALECYTPADRLTSPSFYCDYLGTDDLSVPEHDARSLAELNQLYSHFTPMVASERSTSWRQPEEPEPRLVGSGMVHLDDGELFSQLCTVTNIVKLGPRKGLFLSHVNVGEGLIRVWRDWLAKQAESNGTGAPVLWADAEKNVGIRFGRVERQGVSTGSTYVLVKSDEDLPVSYRLEFSELLVRSSRLLLMLERSETQQVTDSGKAIVIASFEGSDASVPLPLSA